MKFWKNRAFVFLLFVFFSPSLFSQIVERVQAEVGGEMISLIDLKDFDIRIREGLLKPSSFLKPIFKKSELLNFIVTRNMLFQIAKKEKLPEISKEELENKIRKLRGDSSHKNFSLKLKRAGLNLKSLREQVLIDRSIDLLLSQKFALKTTVSEQDIESYHFHKYSRPLFNRFEYEFISVQMTEDKKPAMLKKLREGKLSDLEEMASELGLSAKSFKLKGEDIQSMLKKELDKLFVSQISPVLLLGGRYYVLQLKWKHPQISPSEQKKKAQIENFLYQKKLNEEIQKWIEEQKTMFSIVQHSL